MARRREEEPEEEWSFTVAPAIIAPDGRLWVKLLAYDGENAASYIFEHKTVREEGRSLYEVDCWLSGLWRAPDGELYASAENGEIHVFNGRKWRVMQTPEESMLSTVWGIDGKTVYATGEGCILRLEGGKWNYVVSGLDAYVDCINGIGTDNLYAAGRRGLMLHFDGAAWKKVDIPTNVDINAVYCAGKKRVYAVGAEGVVLTGSGDTWEARRFEGADFVDVTEYQGAMYLAAADEGVFRLENDELKPFRTDIEASSLATAGRYLCVAGDLSVHCFDGTTWESYHYTVQSS